MLTGLVLLAGACEVIDQQVADVLAVLFGQAEQLALGIFNGGAVAADAIAQAVLVGAGDTGDVAEEADNSSAALGESPTRKVGPRMAGTKDA